MFSDWFCKKEGTPVRKGTDDAAVLEEQSASLMSNSEEQSSVVDPKRLGSIPRLSLAKKSSRRESCHSIGNFEENILLDFSDVARPDLWYRRQQGTTYLA